MRLYSYSCHSLEKTIIYTVEDRLILLTGFIPMQYRMIKLCRNTTLVSEKLNITLEMGVNYIL